MSNFSSLLKVELRERLDFRSLKKEKAKSVSFIAVIALAAILILTLSSLYNYVFCDMLQELYVTEEVDPPYAMVLFMMAGIASVLALVSSINQAKSFFIGKDYDLLSSLPIKRSTFISIKILSIYLVELAFSFLIMIPSTIIITLYSNNYSIILAGITMMLLIPVLPIFLGSFFAVFVAAIADRFKYGNIISIFFYFVLLAGIMCSSWLISSADKANTEIMFGVMTWLNPSNKLIELYLNENNILYYLIYVGGSLAIIALNIAFISLCFNSIYALVNSYRGGYKYERKNLKVVGQRKILLKMEFKRFFNSKLYFINSMASGISAIIISIAISIMFQNQIKDSLVSMNIDYSKYLFFGGLIITFMLGITNPCTCGISIEGKNFWQIKSLPIDYKTYIKNKILMSIICLSICVIIASVAMICILQTTDWVSIVTIIVLPLVYLFTSSCIGMFINMIYYRLKWKNEQEVVKNGASIWLSMIVDFALTVIVVILSISLMRVNTIVAAFAPIAISLICGIVFYILCIKKCNKLINNIEEF